MTNETEKNGDQEIALRLAEAANGLVTQMEIEAGSDPVGDFATVGLALAEHPQFLEDAKRVIELGWEEMNEGEETVAAEEGAEEEAPVEEAEESPGVEAPLEPEMAEAEVSAPEDAAEGEEEGEEEEA